MKRNINFNFLFWISYILLIFAEMFVGIKYFSSISTLITLLGLSGLSLYILLKNKSYNFKFLIIFFIFLLCSIVSYLKLRDFTVLKFLILLVSLKNIPFDNFIKKDFKIRGILFVLVVALSFFGFNLINQFYIRGNIKRYTLGFVHPNTAGFYLFLLATEYIYINRDKMHGKRYFFPLLVAIIIQIVTNSRTSFVALIAILCGILYINKSNNKLFESKIFRIICSNLFIILSLIIFCVVGLYDSGSEFALNLNTIFSNRLFYYSRFINVYDLTLLGNSFDTYVLDNTYLQLILRFGLITYMFYYFIFSKMINNSFSKKNYTLVIILVIMLFFGLMENSTYKATYNIFLLSISDIIFQKEKKNEK